MRYYEIKPGDVGKAFLRLFGTSYPVSSFLGRILPSDVGKRVYVRDGVPQVENGEQFAKRILQCPACKHPKVRCVCVRMDDDG